MKNKTLLLIVCSLLVLTGCNPYKRISLSGGEFYGRNKVIKNIDRYDVFVHQADSVYELVDPKALDSERITGQLKSVESEDISNANIDTTAKFKPGEQNDIHIYLDKTTELNDAKVTDQVTIDAESVNIVNITAKKNNGAIGALGIVLLGLLLLVVLIFVILLVALASASDGSDSGTSDSGSGGSDSDSGCYVATMAYGSYEAPQVMTLRRFRDQFLQKYGWGRSFIQWYYRNSPDFVAKHRSKRWLHVILRGGLNVFVFILKPFFK
ncbi:MAG: hypothetical protein GQ574_06550 [Crocinitomix sp.]|nr:hypothetical protein [Crocinitomix sp.]